MAGVEVWLRVDRGRGRETREGPDRGKQADAGDSSLRATGCFRVVARGLGVGSARKGFDTFGPVSHYGAAMVKTYNQISLTRAALTSCGRAKSEILSNCGLVLSLCFVLIGCSPKEETSPSQGTTPGTIGFLDTKTGIGGITLGASLSEMKAAGFGPQEGRIPYDGLSQRYTRGGNEKITFGDFELQNAGLEFSGETLVEISGNAEFLNPNGTRNCAAAVEEYFEALFGKATKTWENTRSAYDSENNRIVTTGRERVSLWQGKKLSVQLQGTSLWILDYKAVEKAKLMQSKVDKDEESLKARNEFERLRKQKF